MLSIKQTLENARLDFQIVGVIDLTNINEPDWVLVQVKLTELRRDEFKPNERIFILMDRDWYRDDKECGILLEGLQRQINAVDISNCFVTILTTNSDIESERRWLVASVSTDPTFVQFIICDGVYHKLHLSEQNQFHFDISHLHSPEKIAKLNEDHQRLLAQKTFCLAPWTHMNPTTTKKVLPCCNSKFEIGDVSKDSLETIWNQEPLREMRQYMLKDQHHPACKICYQTEAVGKHSYRHYVNRTLLQHITKVDKTKEDGSLDEFQMNYLHFKFNNLCNLTCRMCSHNFSSSWHAVASDLGLIPRGTPALLTANDNGRLLEECISHLPNVDLIKFTGGEPLMMPEFYTILEILLEQGRTNVELYYNTNLTVTSFKGKSIFDIWRKFKKVTVGGSLDAEGIRGEYLRSGSKWSEILANRRMMMKQCPDVPFFISATVTIVNAWHLPDFHRSWIEQGLIDPQAFEINLLHNPAYLRLHRAPKELRQSIREKYLAHLQWLRPLDPQGRSTNTFESVLSLLDNHYEEFNRDLFWEKIKELDRYHKTDFLSVFPELRCLA